MRWLVYQIFVKRRDDIDQLILSFVKDLKEQFLKDELIDTYHFLRYGSSTKSWIRFRLGKAGVIDGKTIDTKLREKSKEYDFIEEIKPEDSPVDDETLAKVLYLLSEISLITLENKKNIPDWEDRLRGYFHYFLNQLGYSCLDEANFYFYQELERLGTFLTILTKQPEKYEKVKEIQLEKMDEIKAILNKN